MNIVQASNSSRGTTGHLEVNSYDFNLSYYNCAKHLHPSLCPPPFTLSATLHFVRHPSLCPPPFTLSATLHFVRHPSPPSLTSTPPWSPEGRASTSSPPPPLPPPSPAFLGQFIPTTYNLIVSSLLCRRPVVLRSVLGLVCPVSVYCDRVRYQV